MEYSYINLLKKKTDKCTCCDDAIIELKGWLATQLEDEIKASSQYREAADKSSKLGVSGKDFAKILNSLSDDEYRHFLEITGMVNILNEVCVCKGE